MGLDVCAKVVAGVDFRKAFRESRRKETATRYDPITGQPYQAEVSVLSFVLGNKTLTGTEWLLLKGKFEEGGDEDDEEAGGCLQLVAVYSDGGGSPNVLGVVVAETESHRGDPQVVEFSFVNAGEALNLARRLLEPYGLADQVKLFLVPVVSC
jgi:hypothetical protein